MVYDLIGKHCVLFFGEGTEVFKYEGKIISYDGFIILIQDRFSGLLGFPICKCRLKEIKEMKG